METQDGFLSREPGIWALREIETGDEKMRLRNVLIVVKDMERSIKFYHDLFGLDTVVDQDGNVILT